ncbi:HlyD family secretion protein [Dyadobacter jejuensis]|uniref:HlyD family secretion protein n=1 Tax=Dyadobacter jejuensis TaxID=1082580 RepID=A0A316A9P8_9BACT|nr:HlyD family efflux transporter periplasmic adaptor subunit [Dyadobacter jejuensis]PWJ53594.1 HlyD family secretion protein [Dyadobacter jejuensis]
MQQQLFPDDVLDNSIEGYLPCVAVRSQWIYAVTVAAIILALFSLPFIYIDISVESRGSLRTSNEKTELRSLVSGVIRNVSVSENQSVSKGKVLYEISSQELSSRIQLNRDQQDQKNAYIHDLEKLVKLDKSGLYMEHVFGTSLYAQQFFSFQSKMQENLFHQQKIKKELDADRKLFKERVIAMREFDSKEFEHTQLVAQYESAFRQQKGQWQSDLSSQRADLQQLSAEEKQFAEQRKNYVVNAPVAGTMQQISGKYAGSFIQAGESLGIISPDDSMIIAECYVSPQDIGLIKKGQYVLFRMDTFNYNEWGMVKGKVTDIAQDFTILQDQPVFKVKCTLQKKKLQLKNGYKVTLTKGLSLRAEFVIARRSLYQLIYDKADDWLNPKNG